MIHYNFLKLTQAADAEAVLARCREVYAELEAELDFLHDAKVSRCITVRDSNADIMMVMQLDGPEYLNDYLKHPKHLALVNDMKDYVMDRMSFDEKEAC